VGSVYKPVQTEQIFAFFHDFVKEAQMEIETCGSLWGGKYVWVLARVKNADFALGKKDEMRNYLLLLAPFEHGKALIMQWTSVRVVCWNTLVAALGSALKGKGHAFRMPHTKNFEVEKEEAKRVLGLITEQSNEFKDAATFLSKKKAAKETVDKYFRHLLTNGSETKRDPQALAKYKAALDSSPGGELQSAKGTWWGALNAVTYVIDHQQGKSRDSALKNAWLGNQSILKRRALVLALEEAK
jgi:phage/plasmid-like protein (TIGR03299 family)